MAYSPVPTVNIGDLWTAANHNTYIKNNFAAGVPDIFTAKGDLAAGTAPDAASRVAVGSNGQILQANSAAAAGINWITPYTACELGNASWDGDVKAIGSYTITATTFNASIPAAAKALWVSAASEWDNVLALPSMIFDRPTQAVGDFFRIIGHRASTLLWVSGLVILEGGQFRIRVLDRDTIQSYVYVTGYFL